MQMSDFNIVDGVILAIVIVSSLLAYSRGLVRELMSIAAWRIWIKFYDKKILVIYFIHLFFNLFWTFFFFGFLPLFFFLGELPSSARG
mgnify:CR=1 FL=1